jgi:hypothetical protein
MRPIPFPQQNMVLAEHQPQYESMPCHWDRNTGACVGCFELTDAERTAIAAGDPLWLWQYTFGRPFQPVFLTTDNPWSQTESPTTADECHTAAAASEDDVQRLVEALRDAVKLRTALCKFHNPDRGDPATWDDPIKTWNDALRPFVPTSGEGS